MLRLTKKADYSLIALRHYAARRAEQSTEVAISAKELADCCGIPLPILSKLLQKLTKSGFLTAEYGTNGGYRLAVDPAKISILEVIRAIDGPIVLANCFTAGAFCGHSDKCTVKRPLRRIHDGILRLLESVSIQDILQDEVAQTSTEPSGSAPLLDSGLSQKLVAIDAIPKLGSLPALLEGSLGKSLNV
jgi:Rrf2 family protein